MERRDKDFNYTEDKGKDNQKKAVQLILEGKEMLKLNKDK